MIAGSGPTLVTGWAAYVCVVCVCVSFRRESVLAFASRTLPAQQTVSWKGRARRPL